MNKDELKAKLACINKDKDEVEALLEVIRLLESKIAFNRKYIQQIKDKYIDNSCNQDKISRLSPYTGTGNSYNSDRIKRLSRELYLMELAIDIIVLDK